MFLEITRTESLIKIVKPFQIISIMYQRRVLVKGSKQPELKKQVHCGCIMIRRVQDHPNSSEAGNPLKNPLL